MHRITGKTDQVDKLRRELYSEFALDLNLKRFKSTRPRFGGLFIVRRAPLLGMSRNFAIWRCAHIGVHLNGFNALKVFMKTFRRDF